MLPDVREKSPSFKMSKLKKNLLKLLKNTE